MTTSGTIANTTVDVAKVVEHAVRKCGVPSSVITGEQLRVARENLFLILTALTNKGLNLWCIQKIVQPVTQFQSKYVLPAGTVDLLSGLYRYGAYSAATSYAGAAATLNAGTAIGVTSATVVATIAGTYSLVIEASPDGVTWNQVGSNTMMTASAVGDLLAVDVDAFLTNQYWRVREVALSVTLASVTFLSSTTELPMGVLNRDDYTSYPNKGFASTTILQYWFDKQIQPILHLWPVPSIAGPQVVMWIQRQIQDVGALTGTLDIPQRWLNAIIHKLAAATYLELPPNVLPPGRYEILQPLAERLEKEAEDGETDGAPIRIQPGIRAYSRC